MRSISSRESLAEAIYGFFYSDSIREHHYNLPSMIKSSINDIMALGVDKLCGVRSRAVVGIICMKRFQPWYGQKVFAPILMPSC